MIKEKKYDERSGKGEKSIIPKEIEKWNWGAFLLSFFWGIRHKQWILSILFLIPILNIFIAFLFGFKGNKWAWQSCKWESVKQFQESQSKWIFWGLIIIGLFIVFSLSR
ncbi:ribonuclease G [bacterium]|nr:ribonuclease G [bacterium]